MGDAHWVGKSPRRSEDRRLLRGKGRFLEDYAPLPHIAHAFVVRSVHPHALIRDVDVREAIRVPGVLGVLTAEHVTKWARPFPLAVDLPIQYYPLAVDRVRYVGEPIAVVVAESPLAAADAGHLINVTYEPLPPVTDVERACDPAAPLLHPEVGSNVASHRRFQFGDPDAAFARADLVIRERFVFERHTCLPLETYGVIASYDRAEDKVTIWANFHGPFVLKTLVAHALRLPESAVRVIVPPDIGGSFGIKAGLYPYMALMALASRLADRPVKWIESRQEHLLASSFGAGRVAWVEGAFDREGRLLGLRYRFMDDVGAYMRSPEPAGLYRCFGNMVGAYRVRDVEAELLAVMTNKAPTGLNRGFGGPQLYFALERVMDLAAEKLGLDPIEIRRRNLIEAEAFPYETPSGGIYDSGNYQRALDRLVEISGYRELRELQRRARGEGRLVGIGVATVVDPSGTNIGYVALARPAEQRARELEKSGSTEIARVGVDASGNVTVRLSTCPQGQGHETVAAQVVADELGLRPEEVQVLAEMDTAQVPWTITSGSYSSRFGPLGASAVVVAARELREKMRRIAAGLLEAAVEDVELRGGEFYVKGAPMKRVSWRRVAGAVHWNAGGVPGELVMELEGVGVFSPRVARPADAADRINSSTAYSFLADLAVVEVDRETFEVRVMEYFSVHDCGRVLNPKVVEGQVYGALAHGLEMALGRGVTYDEGGQLETRTLLDYSCVRASWMPKVRVEHLETPSPVSVLGAKGVGEGHTMSAPAAVANAVADALKPLGIAVEKLPIRPSVLFERSRRKVKE
jgi:2-furoyl-CoA dehydrogenase large subunit